MTTTYVSLGLVRSILVVLDRLVINLQKPRYTVSMVIALVREAIAFLASMREETDDAVSHQMEKLESVGAVSGAHPDPAVHRPPSRYTGTAKAFRPTTAVQ